MVSKYVNLALYRAAAELRGEGARTYAGYLWWALEPLLNLSVFYIAFKYIFHRETQNFALFLFSGIVIYRFFSGTVTRSAASIIEGRGLMQLIYVHKSIFPLSVLLVNLVKFLVTLLLVIIALWISGIGPNWAYFTLPLLVGMIFIITAGVSMICAAITPFFPDFQLILGTIMQLLIFLSGVFHDVSYLSPRLSSLIRLNPIAAIIEQFRLVLLHGRWPNPALLMPVILEGIVLVILGWVLIHKFNRYYPKIS